MYTIKKKYIPIVDFLTAAGAGLASSGGEVDRANSTLGAPSQSTF